MQRHLITLLFLLGATTACAHEVAPQRDQISVVGVGEIEAEPDQATLRLSINALAKQLATAKRQADQRYSSVLGVLKESGIADKQIKVVRLTMQPKYEWGDNKQQYKGEEVSRTLTVIINDLDKVAKVMQDLVDNGLSTMDGLTTGFQDRSGLQKKALAAAANDAKSKASFLAEQFDRKLGVAMQVSEHNNAPIQQRQDMSMMKSSRMVSEAAPQEMFGTQIIRASVNASFELR